ncbi:hypothetical protein A2Y85_07130 [candidate division WOR-3 bacterium RBG_13_43_14]|uniref:Serpin domain-containing protein n=1 Tax=candidate division WOR-3 bacterium RBG_13_43_14 TaxID=1802590 RepID=A0A1F4UCZ0_UNCW3|nr:MAG: hypothetical protein A2Y85_07130 [candidate division WOR-3 bacterium RBG_13_43_14]
MMLNFFGWSALFSAFLFGMGGGAKTPLLDDAEMETAVKANNQFGFELYRKLCEQEADNVFISPFSISMAMAMLFEGARDWTAGEMFDVFRFPDDVGIRQGAFRSLYQRINKKDAKYQLNTANALWIQKDFSVLPEYLKTIKDYYFGYAANVDFARAAEQARLRINSWVEEKTNNKIRDLFPPGSLNSDSRLVITNAIYFKGNWIKQFDKALTEEDEFRVNAEQTIRVPMMRRTDADAVFNYAKAEGLELLEMPYEGDDLSMIILLPEMDDLKSVENSLTPEKLSEWKSLLEMRRVDVYIPKFTFKTMYLLNEQLMAMGMPNAFAPHADFSGIDGSKDLFIQTVVHQAYVDVNEEGTEAAAATGIAVGITSVAPAIPEFRADHPFIFLIQERQSGNILFLGRVVKPID